MYGKRYALNVTDLQEEQVYVLVQTMFQALGGGSGPGNKNQASEKIGVPPVEAFRFLTGAPDDWLTTPRQLFAEAVFAATLGGTLREAHNRWTTSHFWCPRNPRAHGALSTAVIDVEFLKGFGLSMARWDDAFSMTGFLARSAKLHDSETDRVRAVVNLSMLGFEDPTQFFTRR